MLTLIDSAYFTNAEMAKRCGLSEAGLNKRRLREGENHAPFVRLGSAVLYPAESAIKYINAWMDGRRRPAA